MTAKAVFFDLWNTLIYCPTRDKVCEVIGLLGIESGYDDFMTGLKLNTFTDRRVRFGDYVRTCLSERNIAYEEKLMTKVERIWENRLENTKIFPETEDVLKDLKKDHTLGLISNLDASGADYFRKNYNRLAGIFDFILLSCEVGLVKPDGRIFQMALDEARVKAKDAWMVGDRVQDDIAGAFNAGINAILLDREGKCSSPDYKVIKSLREVRGVLQDDVRKA